MSAPCLAWMRRDLRVVGNPALAAACAHDGPVVPVYAWSPRADDEWAPGAASRVWTHRALHALACELEAAGSRLTVRAAAAPGEAIERLATETGARAVVWDTVHEPAARARDEAIARRLRARGVEVRALETSLLFAPDAVRTSAGSRYRVFTAFWRACLARPEPAPPPALPARLPAPARWPASDGIDTLGLLPRVDWAAGIRAAWRPGAAGARAELDAFLEAALERYPEDRDRPGHAGGSRLSPYLHHGEIGAAEVWHAVRGRARGAADPYLRQIGWREFAHHLLHHFPHTVDAPLQARFARFPWRRGGGELDAWRHGRTGYPLVDAGMRELWHTGWMHNRARMVTASFLVKHLLVHWCEGARWFWDTLVDADLANNTLGWQWTAGCGADAAPFFRIFNPVTQGERFDPAGRYVRRWVPELARLDTRWIHRPWEAPASALAAAGIAIGRAYPAPIVEHAAARARALAALAECKEGG